MSIIGLGSDLECFAFFDHFDYSGSTARMSYCDSATAPTHTISIPILTSHSSSKSPPAPAIPSLSSASSPPFIISKSTYIYSPLLFSSPSLPLFHLPHHYNPPPQASPTPSDSKPSPYHNYSATAINSDSPPTSTN